MCVYIYIYIQVGVSHIYKSFYWSIECIKKALLYPKIQNTKKERKKKKQNKTKGKIKDSIVLCTTPHA